jgi:hypothetical protein
VGRVGPVQFRFGLNGLDQFDFLKEIVSDWVGSGLGRVGLIYILCFFPISDRFRLDCRSFDLGSVRVRIRSV